MTAAERAERTDAADDLCIGAYDAAGGPDSAVALVAVGGYGRGELAPYSDLDVVLVADEGVDLGELAQQVWYPLWDSGEKIDHSVRSLGEMLEAAAADVRVASGLLDVRHVAGDPSLTIRLRTNVLAHWRRDARQRLPELHELVRSRHRLIGELAHMSVPDLKEAEGGIRDATVLKSLTATWLVDIPAADLERSRLQLLDVRDLLHAAAGPGDATGSLPSTGHPSPRRWGCPTTARPSGRSASWAAGLTHLSRLVWRRADDALRTAPAGKPRRPDLERIAPGVALSRWARSCSTAVPSPASDAVLLLRAAAEAARRNVGPGAADGCPAGARVPGAARPVAGGGTPRDGAPARGRARPARRVGDPRGDRGAGGDPPRVGADPAAAARLGDPPVHRRPARRRDLHRGIRPDPGGVAARRAAGRRAAPRHRQGRRGRAQRRRRADRPGDRDAGWVSSRRRST